jgi:hypothetical protein
MILLQSIGSVDDVNENNGHSFQSGLRLGCAVHHRPPPLCILWTVVTRDSRVPESDEHCTAPQTIQGSTRNNLKLSVR